MVAAIPDFFAFSELLHFGGGYGPDISEHSRISRICYHLFEKGEGLKESEMEANGCCNPGFLGFLGAATLWWRAFSDISELLPFI